MPRAATTCYVVRVGAAAITAHDCGDAVAGCDDFHSDCSSQRGPLTAGAAQIELDTPVTLVAVVRSPIGDPATNQQLTVAGLVDSQTLTVHPSLESAHSAGDPVFALSGPAVATPITSIGAATTPLQIKITLDSSDVVAPGDLIAIGDPLTGECVSVMSIVDDQTITVQPALESVHAVGDAVYAISARPLAQRQRR